MKRAALIGLGMVADTHLRACHDARDVSLVAVMGRDPGKAQSFATRASDLTGAPVHAFTSLSDLLEQAEIDFAILATPPDARLDYMRELARAGIPILAEKPLERDLPAAWQIVELCTDHRVPLGVVFQHRAREASIAFKQAIMQDVLGQIATAEVRVPWWRDQAYYDVPGRGTRARDGGGVTITQAIHTLDLLLWLMGPIRRLQALMKSTILHRMEREDWAGAIFETDLGCVGTIMATTTAFPGASESITLNGTKASAHLQDGVLTLYHRDGRIERVGETATTGGGADPMAFTHGWHRSVIERFAASLDGNAEPLASGRDALMAQAVIDTMERASGSGSWEEVPRI